MRAIHIPPGICDQVSQFWQIVDVSWHNCPDCGVYIESRGVVIQHTAMCQSVTTMECVIQSTQQGACKYGLTGVYLYTNNGD